MSNKDDKKSIHKQIRDLEAQIDNLTKKLGDDAESLEDKIEKRVVAWFKEDEFFAGLRNTPARAIIMVLSALILFGYGFYAFQNPELSLWYLALLLLIITLNAISVRFVFNMDGKTPAKLLDEYHLRRRDKALQRTYKSFDFFSGALLLAAFLYGYKDYIFGDKDFSFSPFPDAVFNFSLTGGQFLVVAMFVTGWVSLQKYWAYGIKGEPFLSKEETRKLRDS